MGEQLDVDANLFKLNQNSLINSKAEKKVVINNLIIPHIF